MKRFYKSAQSAPNDQGFAVTLDGRPVRTPAKQSLTVATRALADAIAAEWDAQDDEIVPADMPMMRMASTAIDRVDTQFEAVVEEIAAYGGTDLVCYRSTDPQELQEREAVHWQPLVEWAGERYGAVLKVTSGIVHVQQDDTALQALHDAVAGYDSYALVALHTAVTVSGSLIIGLALLEGRLDDEAAWAASSVDEHFQAEKWGEDREAAQRQRSLRDELSHALQFFRLSRP